MTYRRDVPPGVFACDDPEAQWIADTQAEIAAANKADADRDIFNAEADRDLEDEPPAEETV